MKSQNFFSLIDDIFADRRSGWIIYLALNKQFAIKDLFSKCDQIRSFLWIWSLLLKSLMKNFIFCAVSLLAIHKIYSDFWNQVKIMSIAPWGICSWICPSFCGERVILQRVKNWDKIKRIKVLEDFLHTFMNIFHKYFDLTKLR